MNAATIARIKHLEARRDTMLRCAIRPEKPAPGWFSACLARAADFDAEIRRLRAAEVAKARYKRQQSAARLARGSLANDCARIITTARGAGVAIESRGMAHDLCADQLPTVATADIRAAIATFWKD